MENSDPVAFFLQVCRTPKMFLSSDRYEAVASFMTGYDTAVGGAALRGFREYLLCQGAGWNNLPWWLLIRVVAEPAVDLSKEVAEGEQEASIQTLIEQLSRFAERLAHGGLAQVYWDYVQWLSTQTDRESQRIYRAVTSPTPEAPR